MDRPRVLIAGGYGVFGRLLAGELLATTTATLLIAGRNVARARALCGALGAPDRSQPVELDVRDLRAFAAAARGAEAVVCAAGPFQDLPPGLPEVCVGAGAHWLDLGDNRAWVLDRLADRALHAAAAAAGKCVFPGLSTTPTLSGILLRRLAEEGLPGLCRARVSLFIGNRNAKGAAAIASSLQSGFHDMVPVEMPGGTVPAFLHESADRDLAAEDLGLDVEFRLALESPFGRRAMALASRLNRRLPRAGRQILARLLAATAAPTSRCGSAGGAMLAEAWDAAGTRIAVSVCSPDQRMAVLPAALGVEALLGADGPDPGVLRPASWLTPQEWIGQLSAHGLDFKQA